MAIDITSKYVFVRMLESTFYRIHGVVPLVPFSERLFVLGGTARGETSSGLWLDVDAWWDAEAQPVPERPAGVTTTLVLWRDIVSVMSFETRQETPPPIIGFRQRT